MIQVVVGSSNPVKLRATEQGFRAMFDDEKRFYIRPKEVSSGVRKQPMSDEETYMGAYNRAKIARKELPSADYFVGIEGGIERSGNAMLAFAWVVVMDFMGHIGKGKTGAFYLPKPIVDLINEGYELGQADDIFFRTQYSKQGSGAVGILTNDAVTRTSLYVPAVIFALIPFQNKEWYA